MELTELPAAKAVSGPSSAPSRIRTGDIRRVESLVGLQAEPRAALIVRTFGEQHDSSEIMLVHEQIDMATPDDVILDLSDSSFADAFVVQTRIRGRVWNLQVGELLGRLTPTQMETVVSAASSRPSSHMEEVGGNLLPSSGDDIRKFQESELVALFQLTGDYTDALLDDGQPWRIDPGLVSPKLLEGADSPAVILTELMHILRTRQVVATVDDLNSLQHSRVFNISTWLATPYGNELASQIAIGVRVLIERALKDMSETGDDELRAPVTVRLPNRVVGATELAAVPGSRLISAPFLWSDGGSSILADPLRSVEGEHHGLEVMMLATSEKWPDSEEESCDAKAASI